MIDYQMVMLLCAICAVAFFYSSVGHGGASGYLAVLSLFAVTPAVMSSTALVLNICVAGISCVMFARAGIFPFRFTLPFLAGSLPASFIGGVITVPNKAYFLLLAAALIVAAIRLSFSSILFQSRRHGAPPPFALAFIAGAVIGLASGILGIGGGIFLSPLILFAGWSDAKMSAAVSAFFIVVNSFSGLAGRIAAGTLHTDAVWPLIGAALVGGAAGSYIGSKKYTHRTLQRVLGAVLLLAALKIFISNL